MTAGAGRCRCRYVGQREPAGARLCPGPGFRACGFSRLTGGQWAGARAAVSPAGVSGPPRALAEAFLGWPDLGFSPAEPKRPGHAEGSRDRAPRRCWAMIRLRLK